MDNRRYIRPYCWLCVSLLLTLARKSRLAGNQKKQDEIQKLSIHFYHKWSNGLYRYKLRIHGIYIVCDMYIMYNNFTNAIRRVRG